MRLNGRLKKLEAMKPAREVRKIIWVDSEEEARQLDEGREPWQPGNGHMSGYKSRLNRRQPARRIVYLWQDEPLPVDVDSDTLVIRFVRTDANGVDNRNAVMLSSGLIFSAGGVDGGGFEGLRAHGRTILIEPYTVEVKPSGDIVVPRYMPVLLVLHNGSVLVTGGHTYWDQPPAVEIELYDPVAGQFSVIGNYPPVRMIRSAVQLDDGRILVFGFSEYDSQFNPSHAAIGDCVYGD